MTFDVTGAFICLIGVAVTMFDPEAKKSPSGYFEKVAGGEAVS